MRLLLIRHGETDHNAGQLALGQFDVPLNERGRRQAQALAEALGSDDIAAVYSSPLQRAVATATPLADALGLEVQIEPGLIEMDVGETDGVPFSDLRERYPDFLRDWMSDRVADVRMPGGECLREVQQRAWSTIEAIRVQARDGDGGQFVTQAAEARQWQLKHAAERCQNDKVVAHHRHRLLRPAAADRFDRRPRTLLDLAQTLATGHSHIGYPV